GRINLVATGSAGEVTLDPSTTSALPPSIGDTISADITIGPSSQIDVSDGGQLFLRGLNVTFDQSQIVATAKETAGGRVDITGDRCRKDRADRAEASSSPPGSSRSSTKRASAPRP